MKRRAFHRLCAGLAVSVATTGQVAAYGPRTPHGRVALVDSDNAPVRASDVSPGTSWVFAYPFVTSPCFLINIGAGEPSGHPLALQTTTSADTTLVAFAAICTHKLSHPAKAISFLSYRPPTSDSPVHRIVCCSEGSVYDAARGAAVLSGPAPAPLAAIELVEDNDGALFATASYAGNLYDRFYNAFGFRLALEYAVDEPRTPVENRTIVRTLEEHSAQRVACF
ncbi:MAG: hypothetical protein AAF460_13315 [Pseudomonadota bacterium]